MVADDWNEDKYTQAAWSTIAPLSMVADYYRTQIIESHHLLDVLINPSKHNTGVNAEVTKGVGDFILSSAGVNLHELRQELNSFLAKQSKGTENSAEKQMGKTLPKVLQSARQTMSDLGDSFVSAEGLILALVKEDNTFTTEALLKQGVKYTDVLAVVKKVREKLGPAISRAAENTSEALLKYGIDFTERSELGTVALLKYGIDFTEGAELGTLDLAIGGDDEIRLALQILSRRTKNNPVLIGDPGVGMTIAKGIAQRMVAGDVPDSLKGCRLIGLDLAGLIAGASTRGEFEECVKTILEEVTNSNGEIILFIDEMHNFVGAQAAQVSIDASSLLKVFSTDASSLLKPAFARGQLRCIGATTIDEYCQYIEKDKALEGRFQQVIINPELNDPRDEVGRPKALSEVNNWVGEERMLRDGVVAESSTATRTTTSSTTVFVPAHCLIWLPFRRGTTRPTTTNTTITNTDTSTTRLWWPALLYHNVSEFDAHIDLSSSNRSDEEVATTKGRLCLALFEEHASGTNLRLARFLGRPLCDFLQLADETYKEFHGYTGAMIETVVCKPQWWIHATTNGVVGVGVGGTLSLEELYMDFHRGLDQAIQLSEEWTSTSICNNDKIFTTRAKAAWTAHFAAKVHEVLDEAALDADSADNSDEIASEAQTVASVDDQAADIEEVANEEASHTAAAGDKAVDNTAVDDAESVDPATDDSAGDDDWDQDDDNEDEEDNNKAVDDTAVDGDQSVDPDTDNSAVGGDSGEDDNNADEEDDNKQDSHAELPIAATPTKAPRLIPTTEKERTSSVVNLYTNALDPPKYNRLHKAQKAVAADAPGFREASESIIIPPEMMFLYQHCLAKPKESFFISAIAHIQVISKVCGLSTKEMIQIRGWVFLKRKSPNGAAYRYQSFSESVYQTMMLGATDDINPRNLVYRFDDIVRKMRTGYADLTNNFPAPLVVPSRKTSRKRGHKGQPLTKYHRGISIGEKDMLPAINYSRKIRNYFEKYQLGVGVVHVIFSDSVAPGYDHYFSLCDSIFRYCVTETGYISTLHDALRVFYGPYSRSADGLESKNRWLADPNLFMVQLKLKFGKPGVMSLQGYEEEVTSNFAELMENNEKKTAGDYTIQDNAVLIRYRVQCFYEQRRSNSKRTNNGNKHKRHRVSGSEVSKTTGKLPIPSEDRLPPSEKDTSTHRRESPGFLNLVHTQAKRKLAATSSPPTTKIGILKFVGGGRNRDTTMTRLPENPPSHVENKMAIEADPGPFKLAAAKKVEAFGPVLVIVPDEGGIDIVLVELSPLDIYYRAGLRLDSHSMTYLSSIPSFEELRRSGYSFEFHSSTKDYVSDSFAILRGATNETVASVMDLVMPPTHSYSAHFKLLGFHGEYQAKRDAGNQAGGRGRGYRIDLGACDHNYDGENANGMGPSPRTNGGVKCFEEKTGNDEIDSSREQLRDYFGSLMDAIQLVVDSVRNAHGYKRIFDDFTREESFAAKLRQQVNGRCSRAEVSSNFVTVMDGNDGCSFHKDAKNCRWPSYDWTCCIATTVESEETGRLYRAVTNLNSRAACGRAMEGEIKFTAFKLGLETEMARIDSSYKEIYGDGPDIPTARTYTDLYLTDDLPWVTETRGHFRTLVYIRAATAPSRDLFLSLAASAISNLGVEEEGLDCNTTVGMLLIALYMCTYQQLYAITAVMKGDEGYLKRMKTDLPGTFWEISDKLYPGSFWGGKQPRFSPSGFDFKNTFVDNKTSFQVAIGELKELLKVVNTTVDRTAVTAKIKEMAGSSNLPGINVFRLQLFIPLAALCGLVLPSNLYHADYIEPAEGVSNGSFSALNAAGFERHRHSDTLLNICGQVGLPRRHSLGECLTCESHRGQKRYDLFIQGQDLFHLFWQDNVYSVKRKRYNSMEWELVLPTSQTKLQSEDCG